MAKCLYNMRRPLAPAGKNMSIHKLIVFSGLALLAACASKPAAQENASFACKNAADCDAKWSLAVAWAYGNAQLGIGKQTDNLIQVYGSTNYSTYGATGYFDFGLSSYSQTPGYIIEKVANPDRSGAIVFHTDCTKWSNCLPRQELARQSFAAAIGW